MSDIHENQKETTDYLGFMVTTSILFAAAIITFIGYSWYKDSKDYEKLVHHSCSQEDLGAFLDTHPRAWYYLHNRFHEDAKVLFGDWAITQKEHSCEGYKNFLEEYPNFACAEKASMAIEKLCYPTATDSSSLVFNIDLNPKCDSLYTIVKNGNPPFKWLIFNTETGKKKLSGKLKKFGRYKIPLSNHCPEGETHTFEITDNNKDIISKTFVSKNNNFALRIRTIENTLTTIITCGTAPYTWQITDTKSGQAKESGEIALAGEYHISLTTCCSKYGEYKFEICDASKQCIDDNWHNKQSNSEIIVPLTSKPLNINIDPLEQKGKLVLEINGGRPPFKIKFGKTDRPAFTLKNKQKRRYVFDMKSYRIYPGVYTLEVTDGQGNKDQDSYPLGACVNEPLVQLEFSPKCWKAMKQESESKSIPFFTYYENPSSVLSSNWNCTLSNEKVEAYARSNFFYNKKNTQRPDACEDIIAKGKTPVIEFFLPDGKSIEKIYDYLSPYEFVKLMERVKNLAKQRHLKRIKPSDEFVVDIINPPNFDTPEAYYLLKTQDGHYRWINQIGPKGFVLQIASFEEENKAYLTARCLLQNGIDKQIYIHPRGEDFKYKVLVAGFANKKERDDFRKFLPESNICRAFLKKGERPFAFRVE